MAAASAVGGLVEIAVEQDCCGALLTTSGAAVDAYAVNIHIGILGSCGFNPSDAIGEAGILEVLVTHLFELLAAVAGAHRIELYDDEAQVSKGGGVEVIGLEGLGDA